MTKCRSEPQRASFGVDAPAVPTGLAVTAAVAAGAAGVLRQRTHRWWPTILAAGNAASYALTSGVY